MTIWPAYDATHQLTLTVTYILQASQADFSDATVNAPGWFAIASDLNHVSTFFVNTGNLRSTTTYAGGYSAWIPDFNPAYVVAINVVYFYDNGTWTSGGSQIVETWGPQTTTTAPATSCFFPPSARERRAAVAGLPSFFSRRTFGHAADVRAHQPHLRELGVERCALNDGGDA
jgi:hypothetical protein